MSRVISVIFSQDFDLFRALLMYFKVVWIQQASLICRKLSRGVSRTGFGYVQGFRCCCSCNASISHAIYNWPRWSVSNSLSSFQHYPHHQSQPSIVWKFCTTGTPQCDGLSPVLFLCYLEAALQDCQSQLSPRPVSDTSVPQDAGYVDDIPVPFSTPPTDLASEITAIHRSLPSWLVTQW